MQIKYNNNILSSLVLIILLLTNLFSVQILLAQPIIPQGQDLVTYSKQSNFIKEFEVSSIIKEERGLRGVATDPQGNAWFYHSTNKTSTIIRLSAVAEDVSSGKFTQYGVEGPTVVDNAIIEIAGGQLVFDSNRNVVWFADARTNSIGKLDITNEKVELVKIPTPKSGPLGIIMSPDGKSVWFAEITGDKIAKLDPESNNKITEYNTGENSGPALLTFDSNGLLWVTLSYANSILRIELSKLSAAVGSVSLAASMTEITLPKPDTFSPFGIAIVDESDGTQKMFVSDHGSSRVIAADISQDVIASGIISSYLSYWTSPSPTYPTTLATQIVQDKQGNVYFPQHIGNRISKIDSKSGIMTEYDIPTGSLATVQFMAVSEDGKKVWFAEWASNKVAYLDTTILIPFDLQLKDSKAVVTLDGSGPGSLDIIVERNDYNNGSRSSSFVSLAEVELAITGMSDSGLVGVTYNAQPQRVDLVQNQTAQSQIKLNVQEGNNDAKPGQYTLMARASAIEKGSQQLVVSKLYPISITLNIPVPAEPIPSDKNESSSIQSTISLNDVIRYLALSVAVGLGAFIIYKKIKRSNKHQK